MINQKNVTIERPITVSITCDCCKKDYPDVLDRQEFLLISETGGFNSAIGDGVFYRCDLCSACVKKILGEYLRYPKATEE